MFCPRPHVVRRRPPRTSPLRLRHACSRCAGADVELVLAGALFDTRLTVGTDANHKIDAAGVVHGLCRSSRCGRYHWVTVSVEFTPGYALRSRALSTSGSDVFARRPSPIANSAISGACRSGKSVGPPQPSRCAACTPQRLRVPSRSVRHAMVHVPSLDYGPEHPDPQELTSGARPVRRVGAFPSAIPLDRGVLARTDR